MIFLPSLISVLEVLLVVVPVLLTVAFVTVAERKTMASMQRRLGPNVVGYWGLLQAFADALKLLIKEYVSPTQANLVLFFLGPIITLIFSLLGYAVVPYGPGLAIWDFNLGILYMLAVSSLSTYGILLAGWSANSKYAFLGSLRSTAQLISYELILSSAILLVVLLTGSLNLTVNIEFQRAVWFAIPLLPVFIIFFIGSVAETNRAPFDLAEAESELVSGFMTEHAAVIFVFFFLAEYASIVLICILTSMLFLGGYLLNYIPFVTLIKDILESFLFIPGELDLYVDLSSYPMAEGLLYGLSLGIKSSILVFTFIWVRASFPRIRYDQLMSYSWTVLLPIVIAFIVLVPCILYSFEIIPSNITLLFIPLFTRSKLNNTYKKASSNSSKNISFIDRIFNILILFTIGFTSRFVINTFFDVNVFVDYLSGISIGYYISLSTIAVYVNEYCCLTKFSENIVERSKNIVRAIVNTARTLSNTFSKLNKLSKLAVTCNSGVTISPTISSMDNSNSAQASGSGLASGSGTSRQEVRSSGIKRERTSTSPDIKRERPSPGIKREGTSTPPSIKSELHNIGGVTTRSIHTNPIYMQSSYSRTASGLYLAHDPHYMAARGYVDPTTGNPYQSQQPMLDSTRKIFGSIAANSRYPKTIASLLQEEVFDNSQKNYITELLNHNYPGWNTNKLRNTAYFRASLDTTSRSHDS